MGLELYYNCAFRRARLPGLPLELATLSPLDRRIASHRKKPFTSIDRRQSNRPSEAACIATTAIHPVAGPKQLPRVRMHSMHPRRRTSPATTSAGAVAFQRLADGGLGGSWSGTLIVMPWWRRSFTSATRRCSERPWPRQPERDGAQTSVVDRPSRDPAGHCRRMPPSGIAPNCRVEPPGLVTRSGTVIGSSPSPTAPFPLNILKARVPQGGLLSGVFL